MNIHQEDTETRRVLKMAWLGTLMASAAITGWSDKDLGKLSQTNLDDLRARIPTGSVAVKSSWIEIKK